MSKKQPKIEKLLEGCEGRGIDPHYAGFFRCFNRGLFFEAHEVLEALWLKDRSSPNYGFYKGLIQLAGAFVHLQKNRLRPASALFKLARENFAKYPEEHQQLDLKELAGVIDDWQVRLEVSNWLENPLRLQAPPRLALKGEEPIL